MSKKRGQMTIWIIVAIVLVSIILLFFLFRGEIIPTISTDVREDPKSYIDSCVRKNVNDAVDLMLPQGGFISPEHSKMYKNINVSYLCYNSGSYHTCVDEHPMLLNEMLGEIKGHIEPKIEQCFLDYKDTMEKKNIGINFEQMNLEVEFGEQRIFVNIDRKVTINKQGESYSLNEFNSEIINPAYDLARVSMEIASQEAEYCYFEYAGYMILYPDFKINLDTMSDSTKIYSIEDKKSKKTMNIAIRSCAIPPGL